MSVRIEKDTFGPIEVPANSLWGAQTARSLKFFAISSEKIPEEVLMALAVTKKAAAAVNMAKTIMSIKKTKNVFFDTNN